MAMPKTPTKQDFENYTGNLRIKHISFDAIAQMWAGNKEEYDPKTEEPLAKFYVGKVGKYDTCTYIYNDYMRCACINVIFTNGYSVTVDPADVEFTEEEQTWEEFLPKIPKPGEDTNVYKKLTDAQKEFADKVFLQMVTGQHQLFDKDLRMVMDQAICMSQYRADMYSRGWDTTWLKDLDD
jgi:hypothetical protein